MTLVTSGYPYTVRGSRGRSATVEGDGRGYRRNRLVIRSPAQRPEDQRRIEGIEVTADLVGNDGVQDIIGYREDTVFIFSGKDGTPALPRGAAR